MLAMELSNYLNVFEHVRLALEVPELAGDRGVGSYNVELAPMFESAMGFDCEFEKVVHRKLAVLKKELLSDIPLVITSGMSRRTSDSRSWTVAPWPRPE